MSDKATLAPRQGSEQSQELEFRSCPLEEKQCLHIDGESLKENFEFSERERVRGLRERSWELASVEKIENRHACECGDGLQPLAGVEGTIFYGVTLVIAEPYFHSNSC